MYQQDASTLFFPVMPSQNAVLPWKGNTEDKETNDGSQMVRFQVLCHEETQIAQGEAHLERVTKVSN